jgi:arylsulfatase A-like enzyme
MFLYLVTAACSNTNELFSDENDDSPEIDISDKKTNILFIIADDMGLDASPGYDIGTLKPNMPNLQKLMDSGVKFTNLWSNPTCTPTRAGIITGKYGFRTNVLAVDDPLSTSEISLQKYIDIKTNDEYANAVIGKWHLSRDVNHPNNMGVDYYAGVLGGGVPSYYNWSLVQNGKTSNSKEYTTTKFTDLAIDWIGEQSKPWFLWLAYNAPHTPFHVPPSELHYQGYLSTDQGVIDANPLPYYMAAIEALDTEMGRLINTLSEEDKENTVVIFIGDNGTPNQVAQEYQRRRVKGSIYQGGVNVPMVISGKGVTRINNLEDALINTTDLFATIANIAGVSSTEINDSKSFKNLLSNHDASKRDYVYTENQDYSIRNATHKYIYFRDGSEALYDLTTNSLENPNLLNSNQLPLSESNSQIKEELLLKVNEIRN